MRWLIGIWIVIKNTFGRGTGKDTPGQADAVNVKDAFVIIPGLMPSFRETFSASIFEVANWKLANKIIQIGIFIFKNVFGEYVNSQSITMSSRALRKVQSFIAIMSPLIAHYSPIITASLLTDILIYFSPDIFSAVTMFSLWSALPDWCAGPGPRLPRLVTPARVTPPQPPSLSVTRWLMSENGKCDGKEDNWIVRKKRYLPSFTSIEKEISVSNNHLRICEKLLLDRR